MDIFDPAFTNLAAPLPSLKFDPDAPLVFEYVPLAITDLSCPFLYRMTGPLALTWQIGRVTIPSFINGTRSSYEDFAPKTWDGFLASVFDEAMRQRLVRTEVSVYECHIVRLP